MFKRKRILKSTGLAVASCFMAYGAMAEVMRYTDYGPNRGTRYDAMEWFANEIDKKSDGGLAIDYFWGGSLVSMAGTLDALSSSVADMGTIIGFASPRALRGYNIGDLPVENSDIWVGLRSLHDLAKNDQELQSEFDEQGITYISGFSTGPIQLICRNEVSTIEDLEGLRIRASGPYGAALAELGARVESMSQADVYQALDSGLLDCNQNYYYSMRAYRQFEVAPYALELNWGQNMAFGIFMSTLTYDRLNEDMKNVLTEVGDEFIDYFSRLQIGEIVNDKEAMVSGIDGYSLTVSELNQNDRELLIKAGYNQIDSWVESASSEGMEAEDVLLRYEDLITNYTQELNDNGYPWSR